MRKNYLVLFLLITFLSFTSCSKTTKAVFIIDTSGSMRTDDRIEIAKKEVKKFLNRNINGETTYYIATFDVSVKEIYYGDPDKDMLKELNSRIDLLQAKGQWTYMDKALDYIAENLDRESKSKQVAYIFTDGLNDVPPGEEERNFYEIISEKFNTWDKKYFTTYIIDLTNEVGKKKISGVEIISYTWFIFKTYILPFIIFGGVVFLILLFIGYRNKITKRSENIKFIARLRGENEVNEDSPEEIRARINLNRYLFGTKKIDLGKEFSQLFDFGPNAMIITIDKYERRLIRPMIGHTIKVSGMIYSDEPWAIQYNRVFSIDNKFYIIK